MRAIVDKGYGNGSQFGALKTMLRLADKFNAAAHKYLNDNPAMYLEVMMNFGPEGFQDMMDLKRQSEDATAQCEITRAEYLLGAPVNQSEHRNQSLAIMADLNAVDVMASAFYSASTFAVAEAVPRALASEDAAALFHLYDLHGLANVCRVALAA
jgi:hypothetical protein